MVDLPYWNNVSPGAVIGFAGAILAAALPYLRMHFDGRREKLKSQAELVKIETDAAENEAIRMERVGKEQFQREQARADRLENDLSDSHMSYLRLEGQARAMENWAHWFRHWGNNEAGMRLVTIELIDKYLRDEVPQERIMAHVQRILANPPKTAPTVPLLHEADIKNTPE